MRVWFRELGKIHRDKKLTFLYLANDVVQNSKKKHPEYAKEFGSVMKKAMEHLSVLTMDEKTVKSIDRLLNIWKERMIFEPRIQTDLNRIWATKSLETKGDIDTATASPTSPSPKRAKKGCFVLVFRTQAVSSLIGTLFHSSNQCQEEDDSGSGRQGKDRLRYQ